RVAIAAPSTDLEIEPNDRNEQAQSMTRGTSVHARLGWRSDRDVFCAAKGTGTARFVVVDRARSPRSAREQISVTPIMSGVAEGPVLLAPSALQSSFIGAGGAPPNDASSY